MSVKNPAISRVQGSVGRAVPARRHKECQRRASEMLGDMFLPDSAYTSIEIRLLVPASGGERTQRPTLLRTHKFFV